MSDMRAIIREILLEELGNYVDAPTNESHTEHISINSNSDIKAFALQVLEISQTRDLKNDLQSGKVQFILDRGQDTVGDRGKVPARPQQPGNSDPVHFQKGLVTEKDISKLAVNITSINASNAVFFTPLAKDEIRRRGLKIERNSQ
jgi:hypothetical protein